mgnify:CR=1 FL=1
MNQRPANIKDVPFEFDPGELILGDLKDIRVMRIEPLGKLGIHTATLYTGFLCPDLQKHFIKRTTTVVDNKEAQDIADHIYIRKLIEIWQTTAKNRGIDPENTDPDKQTKKSEGSIGREMLDNLNVWEERGLVGRSTLRGYATATNSFILRSEGKAFDPKWVPTEEECEEILTGMLKKTKKETGGPKKLTENLRYCLKRATRFPAELTDLFDAEKKNVQAIRAKGEEYPISAKERAIIWENLPKADRITRGLILLLANSCQHGIDIANLTVKALREALKDITFWDRQKTGFYFRMIAWEEVFNWFKEMNFHDDDIYVFDFGYTAEERQVPNFNRVPLQESDKEAAKRRSRASGRAGTLVKNFLQKICGLKRKGLSIHSFRHTNISEWEAEGWPRLVGMACSGHGTEANYLDYAHPIRSHIRSLSGTTHDFWAHAERERVYIFTITQLYEAIVAVIDRSKSEVLSELQNSSRAQVKQTDGFQAAIIGEMQQLFTFVVKGFEQITSALAFLVHAHAMREGHIEAAPISQSTAEEPAPRKEDIAA